MNWENYFVRVPKTKIKELNEDERIGTANTYDWSMQSLKKFSPDVSIKDITPKFLEKYEKWMVNNGNSLTTVGIYLRNLRAILNIAKEAKLLTEEAYPFGLEKNKYVIPTGSKVNKATEVDNLKMLKNIECHSDEAMFAKDIWFFSFYCNGMKACLLYARGHLPFGTIWSFTSLPNKSSERVMQKIGMTKVKEFPHPAVPDGHPLKEHVLYSIKQDQ